MGIAKDRLHSRYLPERKGNRIFLAGGAGPLGARRTGAGLTTRRGELKVCDSLQDAATGSDRLGESLFGCGVSGGEDDEFRGCSATSSSSDPVSSTPHRILQVGCAPNNLQIQHTCQSPSTISLDFPRFP